MPVSIIVSEPGVLAAQLQRIADTKKPSSTCTFLASRLIHGISNLVAHALLVQRNGLRVRHGQDCVGTDEANLSSRSSGQQSEPFQRHFFLSIKVPKFS